MAVGTGVVVKAARLSRISSGRPTNVQVSKIKIKIICSHRFSIMGNICDTEVSGWYPIHLIRMFIMYVT